MVSKLDVVIKRVSLVFESPPPQSISSIIKTINGPYVSGGVLQVTGFNDLRLGRMNTLLFRLQGALPGKNQMG